jgi:hypothetical protein
MPTLIGIRDGHRYTITITRPNGVTRIERRHHPECPCRTDDEPAHEECLGVHGGAGGYRDCDGNPI